MCLKRVEKKKILGHLITRVRNGCLIDLFLNSGPFYDCIPHFSSENLR